MNSYVVNLYPVPNGATTCETFDVSGTVKTFTSSFDYKTTCCYITAATGDLFVTFDGTTPSSTNGHRLVAPYAQFWSKESARNAKMIAATGTASHVTMSQFTY